jgi:hypothetical protein
MKTSAQIQDNANVTPIARKTRPVVKVRCIKEIPA